MGSFATGVAVVTARDPSGGHRGITVNSLASVSLDPPLVLFCLDKSAMSFEIFRLAEVYAVNVLCKEQHETSIRFSTPLADKWDGVAYDLWPGELPILRGCLANMACRRETLYDGGDHVIIVGRVEHLQATDEGDPLVYFQSAYRSIGPSV